MVATIARREIRDLLRDRRFAWLGACVVLLAVAGLASSYRDYRHGASERVAVSQSIRRDWLAQGRKDPHLAAHYGTYAFQPASVLAALEPGLQPFLGVAVFLEAHRQNVARYVPAADRSMLQRFGDLSLAGVTHVLLPLVVVLFGHSSVAGERERGTLALALSQGVTPRQLLAGKMAGLSAALLGLCLPLSLGVFAVVQMGALDAVRDGSRLAAFLGSTAAYVVLWIAGTLLVSSRVASSRAALVILFACWAWGTVAAPRLAAALEESVYATPTPAAFSGAVQRDLVGGGGGGEGAAGNRLDLLKAATLREYGVARVEDLPINFRGVSLQAGEDHAAAVWDAHFGALQATYAAQDRLRSIAAIVAPPMAARSLSMALAGTDLDHHLAFTGAAERHRRAMVRQLNLDLAYHSRTGDRYEADGALWSSVPDFTHERPGIRFVVSRQGIALAVLACWTVAIALAVIVGAPLSMRGTP